MSWHTVTPLVKPFEAVSTSLSEIYRKKSTEIPYLFYSRSSIHSGPTDLGSGKVKETKEQ